MALRFLYTALSIYMFLIVARILLSWIQGLSLGKGFELLCSITDPYINFFRRFKFLHIGHMDFSAVGAIVVLSIISNIIGQLILHNTITVWIIFSIILTTVWSMISWFIGFFIILCLIRVITLVFAVRHGKFTQIIDMVLQPLLQYLQIKVLKGRIITFRNALLLICASLLVLWFFLQWLVVIFNNFLTQL